MTHSAVCSQQRIAGGQKRRDHLGRQSAAVHLVERDQRAALRPASWPPASPAQRARAIADANQGEDHGMFQQTDRRRRSSPSSKRRHGRRDRRCGPAPWPLRAAPAGASASDHRDQPCAALRHRDANRPPGPRPAARRRSGRPSARRTAARAARIIDARQRPHGRALGLLAGAARQQRRSAADTRRAAGLANCPLARSRTSKRGVGQQLRQFVGRQRAPGDRQSARIGRSRGASLRRTR